MFRGVTEVHKRLNIPKKKGTVLTNEQKQKVQKRKAINLQKRM